MKSSRRRNSSLKVMEKGLKCYRKWVSIYQKDLEKIKQAFLNLYKLFLKLHLQQKIHK